MHCRRFLTALLLLVSFVAWLDGFAVLDQNDLSSGEYDL